MPVDNDEVIYSPAHAANSNHKKVRHPRAETSTMAEVRDFATYIPF